MIHGLSDADIGERLAKVETHIQAHAESCDNFRRIAYTVIAIALSVMIGLATQVFYFYGRLEGMTATLNEHSNRMVTIVSANVAREQRLDEAIKELKTDIRGLRPVPK